MRRGFSEPIDLVSDDDIPFETIVDSHGQRRGQPQVHLPDNVDSVDYPDNVLYSLRLGERGNRWFPAADDICSLCRDGHSESNPCFYTACGHIFHRNCWENLGSVDVNHPHLQRLDGSFEPPPPPSVENPHPRPPLDLSLTLCPNCRSYVSSPVVRFNPCSKFLDGYNWTLGWSHGIEIRFRNQEVLPQPEQSSEWSGSHHGHCGALATFNTGQYLSGSPLTGPEAEAELERRLRDWREQQRRGLLNDSTNMAPGDIIEYIFHGGHAILQTLMPITWCPTVSHGRSIADTLREFVRNQGRLPLITNNTSHWFSLILEWISNSCVQITYLEPFEAANAASISIINRFLLPQLQREIEFHVVSTSEPPPPENNTDFGLQNESIEVTRDIRRQQDEEYAHTLLQDRQRFQVSAEMPSAQESDGLAEDSNESNEISRQRTSTRREDQQIWSRLLHNTLLPSELERNEPRRSRPNRRYNSDYVQM